jgi:hypothetical protein
MPHTLEMHIPTILNRKDKAVLELSHGLAHVLKLLLLVVPTLLGHLRQVDDFCALGFRHSFAAVVALFAGLE